MATDNEKPAPKNNLNIPKIRTNFKETAFFYPQIYTSCNGEAEIKFTLPDAITRWNFGFFAHTKEMQYGSLITDIVSRKMMQIEAEPGEYVISYELVDSPRATIRVSNMRVDYGPGKIKGTLLKILK